MPPGKLTQSALAKQWRCSQPAIAKLVARGMPLTSEGDARAWKEAHQQRRSRTEVSEEERALRLRVWRLRLDRAEYEFQRTKDLMLPVAQFEAALARMRAAFLAELDAFAVRINEQIEGLDYNDRGPVLEAEVDLLRKTLARCDFLTSGDENAHAE